MANLRPTSRAEQPPGSDFFVATMTFTLEVADTVALAFWLIRVRPVNAQERLPCVVRRAKEV